MNRNCKAFPPKHTIASLAFSIVPFFASRITAAIRLTYPLRLATSAIGIHYTRGNENVYKATRRDTYGAHEIEIGIKRGLALRTERI